MSWSDAVWFVLMIGFVFAEASTVSLVSVWFAAGALAALIVSLLGGEVWLQITVFLTVSAVLLISLRRLARKYLTPKITKTNVDSLIGEPAMVITAVDNPTETGQVKVKGMEWSARSTTGAPIPVRTQVRIDRVEGVKLYVSVMETV